MISNDIIFDSVKPAKEIQRIPFSGFYGRARVLDREKAISRYRALHADGRYKSIAIVRMSPSAHWWVYVYS